MKSLDRVMAGLAGKPVDRPPVFAVLGAYGGKLTGVPLPELYQSAERFADGQRAVLDTFAVDLVVGSFDFSILAEAFGGTPRFFEDQAPNMRRPGAASAAEAMARPFPDPRRTGRLPMTLDVVGRLSRSVAGSVPVAASLPGPISLPALLLGLEGWMDTLLFRPEEADRLLAWSGKFWVEWGEELRNAGADILVVTEGFAAEEIVTRELFQTRLRPHLARCFQALGPPLVVHHTGGRINHVIDLLAGLTGLAGVVVSSRDHLFTARRLLGPGIPILGNLDNLAFASREPEELFDEAARCFQAGREMGPHLVCNSGADIPIATPPETIHAFTEAARSSGRGRCTSVPVQNGPQTHVCCGVLRAEIEHIRKTDGLEGSFRYLSSRLHLHPVKVGRAIEATIDRSPGPVALVYGDCSPAMSSLASRPGVSRVDATNCCEMVLGRTRYRELLRQGAFFLLPEWMPTWRSVLEDEFGMSFPVAQDFMREHCTGIVYIDTGIQPVPVDDIEACATYMGLPWRIEAVGLGPLRRRLAELRVRSTRPWGDPAEGPTAGPPPLG